eukprot:SAG31_NODE_4637_length_3079_cov_1.843624_1_plen_185_part_00
MHYLVPAALICGQAPTIQLLCKYRRQDRPDLLLSAYCKLVEAVVVGNLPLYDHCMQEHQASLVQLGVWLTFHELRLPTFRNFLRRYTATLAAQSDPFTFLSLATVCQVLSGLRGNAVTLDDVLCLTQQLLAKRYVRGYITDFGIDLLSASKTDIVVKAYPKLRFYSRSTDADFLEKKLCSGTAT